MYTKKDFEKQIKSLAFDDFNIKGEIMGYSWRQEVEGRMNQIVIGYKSYPGSFYLQTPFVSITFPAMEDQLNALYDKHKIELRYGEQTIHANLGNIKDVNYKSFDTEINSEETFKVVAHEIEKIFTDGALPFFKKYKDLKAISEDISKMSEDEISNFVSGIVGIKVPLIKKIAQSSDYLIELKQRQKFYSDEVFKYPQYFKDHDKVFHDLFSSDLEAI